MRSEGLVELSLWGKRMLRPSGLERYRDVDKLLAEIESNAEKNTSDGEGGNHFSEDSLTKSKESVTEPRTDPGGTVDCFGKEKCKRLRLRVVAALSRLSIRFRSRSVR